MARVNSKDAKTKSSRYPGVYVVEGKKGKSYGIDYYHPGTGERIRKVIKGVRSEADAFEIRSIEVADAKRGHLEKAYQIKRTEKSVLFEDMIRSYLKWSQQNKKSWQTDEHNAKPVRQFFKGRHMAQITAWMAEKYKAERSKQIAKATVNNELSLANQVYQKAIEWGKYKGGNPFEKVRFKRRKGKKPGALTPEQVQAITDEIQHPVKRDMVAFAYYAGWRISEIRKLQWEDVDLEKGTAWVVDTKNLETVKIELGDEALEILRRQEKRSPYVFCHLNGKPYKTNLKDVIKNAAERAGVYLPPRKRWHILRRTWASMMLQRGCDVETLRVLGNWKDSSMPLWYAEPAGTERRKEALNQIPSLGALGRKKPEIEKVVELSDRKNED